MPKIVSSEAAPAEAVHYSFAGVEFDLAGRSKSYETDDVAVLTAAETHPWLRVERAKVDIVQGAYVDQIAPKDDPMSALNSVANNPDEARKVEEEKVGGQLVAIDAGEVQTESVVTGQVAETLAADESSKTHGKQKN